MSFQEKELLISIGRITNSFGLTGEVKVQPLTDFPERFDTISSVILSRTGKDEEIVAKVTRVKYVSKFVILKLNISNTIEEAKSLKGLYLWIEKEELHPLPTGSFYIFDLIGLDVYLPNGEFVGKVKDVQRLPSNDLFVVSNNEKEMLIPALKEFVEELNPASGRIVVRSKEGIF